jgi:hypothetical protein
MQDIEAKYRTNRVFAGDSGQEDRVLLKSPPDSANNNDRTGKPRRMPGGPSKYLRELRTLAVKGFYP